MTDNEDIIELTKDFQAWIKLDIPEPMKSRSLRIAQALLIAVEALEEGQNLLADTPVSTAQKREALEKISQALSRIKAL